MAVSLTHLRANLYKIVDEALASGLPVEIERHGQQLKIVPTPIVSKLSRLERRESIVVGDFEDIVNFDASQYWDEEKNL